jgi:DNA-binding transcriptional LysR family regulator
VVSSVMSVAGGVLPRLIAAYHDDRPGIEIHVREGVYASIIDDVRGGVADFGIGYVDALPDFAVGTALGRETFHAVVPVRHKLAGRRSVALAELAAHPIVALPTESRTRRTIDAAAVTAGLQLRQRVVVTQIATLLALVAAGAGVGVVPGGATRGPLPPGVRVVPLVEPKLVRRLGLITLRGRELTPAAAGLFALLRREWRKAD